MKMKIIFYVFILLCVNACSNSGSKTGAHSDSTQSVKLTDTLQTDSIIVATATGGTAIFIVDTNTLKSDWQNFMNSQPGLSPTTISRVEIVYANNLYYLRAWGTLNSIPMASTMNTHTDPGSGHDCIIVGGSSYVITCTTTDCSSEPMACFPELTHCTPCSNKGKCTRTISSGGSAVFPNLPTTSKCL